MSVSLDRASVDTVLSPARKPARIEICNSAVYQDQSAAATPIPRALALR
jgi:hypothetical protein